jgi:hypothetical protein
MAGDLVKVGRNDQNLVRVSPARQAMSNALTRLRQCGEIVRSDNAQPVVLPPPSRTSGAIIDLPRICAVHNKPYASRYIRDAKGRFRYAQAIRITDRLCDQYEVNLNDVRVMPREDCQDETCPWCGAYGFGSILCGLCRTEICYGRTNGRYFRCRPSCGEEGTMEAAKKTMRGLSPSLPNSASGTGGR